MQVLKTQVNPRSAEFRLLSEITGAVSMSRPRTVTAGPHSSSQSA